MVRFIPNRAAAPLRRAPDAHLLDTTNLDIDAAFRAAIDLIDAAMGAIQRATGVEGRLVSFHVSAVTGGTDALGDVVIQLDVDGRRVTGRGVATDVVEASARAYLAAVNRSFAVAAPSEASRDASGAGE